MEIRFTDVGLEQGGRRVLSVPRLRLAGGRTTAVLGPNGAGKTSLLRLIAGLDRPLTGLVEVGGDPVDPRQHRVAYAFQDDVFLRRSVHDNLALGLRLRGVGRHEVHARVDEALRQLGIAHLADRRADRLSGGEWRRASLARALCLRAPVVLLDEPLAGLDRPTRHRLLDELPPLLASSRATSIVVTHSSDEAFRLAEDLVVVVDGTVMAAGTKQEVAANPQHAVVADVLGYRVLPFDGRLVAVPSGALAFGPGPVTFTLEVDAVTDLVDRWSVSGSIGSVRVHLPLSRQAVPPRVTERLPVSAPVAYDVT